MHPIYSAKYLVTKILNILLNTYNFKILQFLRYMQTSRDTIIMNEGIVFYILADHWIMKSRRNPDETH